MITATGSRTSTRFAIPIARYFAIVSTIPQASRSPARAAVKTCSLSIRSIDPPRARAPHSLAPRWLPHERVGGGRSPRRTVPSSRIGRRRRADHSPRRPCDRSLRRNRARHGRPGPKRRFRRRFPSRARRRSLHQSAARPEDDLAGDGARPVVVDDDRRRGPRRDAMSEPFRKLDADRKLFGCGQVRRFVHHAVAIDKTGEPRRRHRQVR